MSVAVVEARRIGRQVTGKSTAKVTSQHRLIYRTLKSKFGNDRARLYVEAQETAISKMSNLAKQHNIDCDWEPKAAYVYACDDGYVGQIEEEVEVARSFGLLATLVTETGLPFEVRAALRFDTIRRISIRLNMSPGLRVPSQAMAAMYLKTAG